MDLESPFFMHGEGVNWTKVYSYEKWYIHNIFITNSKWQVVIIGAKK